MPLWHQLADCWAWYCYAYMFVLVYVLISAEINYWLNAVGHKWIKRFRAGVVVVC